MSRASVAVLVALVSASCGAPLLKLPTEPGSPTSNARAALDEATSACRRANTVTAEVRGTGTVAGRRLRARLLVGFQAPASARLEAAAPFGAPIFILVANGSDATLLLPRDNRVLEHGSAEAVLEAIAGVPLDAAGLRMAITGCTLTADGRTARQIGDEWIVVPDGANEIYLNRKKPDAPWQIVATVHRDQSRGEWRAEYGDRVDGLPRTVRLASADDRFDLRLVLSQVEINVALGAEAFRVRIPPEATPMTLPELRESGPLADQRSNGR